MHEYTITGHDRKMVYYVMAFLSAVVSSFLSGVLLHISQTTNISIFTAPSGVAIYGFLFIIFDKWIWRWDIPILSSVLVIPNMNGEWEGHINSSLPKSKRGDIPITITISQTYSKIRIRLESEYSQSLSQMATIQMQDPSFCSLSYEYLSEYRPDTSTVDRHYGVAKINLTVGMGKFAGTHKGSYYTEKSHNSSGEITLTRSQKEFESKHGGSIKDG